LTAGLELGAAAGLPGSVGWHAAKTPAVAANKTVNMDLLIVLFPFSGRIAVLSAELQPHSAPQIQANTAGMPAPDRTFPFVQKNAEQRTDKIERATLRPKERTARGNLQTFFRL
jgi:hypothetical protein